MLTSNTLPSTLEQTSTEITASESLLGRKLLNINLSDFLVIL